MILTRYLIVPKAEEAKRVSLRSTDGRPVSTYIIDRDIITDEGENDLYGGYFVGKLANPHLLINEDLGDQQLFQYSVGCFIGERARKYRLARNLKTQQLDAEHIVADCLKSLLDLCPWLKYYFARYQNRADAWEFFQSYYPRALLHSGFLIQEKSKYSYTKESPLQKKNDELSKARFWALGAKFHPNMKSFPDIYIKKAIASAKELGVYDLAQRLEHDLHSIQSNDCRRANNVEFSI